MENIQFSKFIDIFCKFSFRFDWNGNIFQLKPIINLFKTDYKIAPPFIIEFQCKILPFKSKRNLSFQMISMHFEREYFFLNIFPSLRVCNVSYLHYIWIIPLDNKKYTTHITQSITMNCSHVYLYMANGRAD